MFQPSVLPAAIAAAAGIWLDSAPWPALTTKTRLPLATLRFVVSGSLLVPCMAALVLAWAVFRADAALPDALTSPIVPRPTTASRTAMTGIVVFLRRMILLLTGQVGTHYASTGTTHSTQGGTFGDAHIPVVPRASGANPQVPSPYL